MTYAVLSPSPDAKTVITEVREIRHSGQLVGQPEVRIDRSDGTYSSTVPLRLSANSEKGVCIVRTIVQSENATDTKESKFTVE